MGSDTIRSASTEAAFGEWKAIHEEISRSGDETDSAEHPLWGRLQSAENRIMQSDETGPRVAEIRLWLGLTKFGLLYQSEHEAARREDADWLLQYARSGEQQNDAILYAIKALRSGARPAVDNAAQSTKRIVSRFLAIGGRFMIDPQGQPDAAINMRRILSLETPEQERTRLRRSARAAQALIDQRRDQIVTLIRQHGRQSAGWLLWENVA
jgi:hypothetical protein